MTQDGARLAQKHVVTIAKFGSEQDPERDEPYAVETTAAWYDMDGTEITDPDRIAALERSAREQPE